MQQRQTTTKSDIKEAFIQLLATKSLEDITISQLTKKAGVNRSTFYLHYLDKQDFLEQIKRRNLVDCSHDFKERNLLSPPKKP